MLIAIMTWFLLGSSGTSVLITSLNQVESSIKADIGDKIRRSELVSVIDEAEKSTKEYDKAMGKLTEEFTVLMQRHDAQSADIQPLLEKSRTDNEAYQDQMVSYLFSLKEKMSREEWAKVFPAKQDQPAKK